MSRSPTGWPLVEELQPPVVGEPADDRRLDVLVAEELEDGGALPRRHGEDHAFLRLGDPDLRVAQALVLERHAVEVDLGAELLAHLADGAGEAAGAAVGDGGVQAAVAGLEDACRSCVFSVMALPICTAPEETVSDSSVSSPEENVAPWMPSRPVRPPTTRIIVAGLRGLAALVARDQADVAAVDQRVAEVALVEEHRAVDGGDAHAVAVVAHAGDHALHHAPRVQHAGRHLVRGQVGRAEAEDVGVGDRLGAQAGADRVADDAADAGGRAAVRLDGRRVVVRLDLEADGCCARRTR